MYEPRQCIRGSASSFASQNKYTETFQLLEFLFSLFSEADSRAQVLWGYHHIHYIHRILPWNEVFDVVVKLDLGQRACPQFFFFFFMSTFITASFSPVWILWVSTISITEDLPTLMMLFTGFLSRINYLMFKSWLKVLQHSINYRVSLMSRLSDIEWDVGSEERFSCSHYI